MTLEFPDGLSHKGSNEGSGVTLAAPNEPNDMEKTKKAKDGKEEEGNDADKQEGEDQAMDKQSKKVQAKVSIPKPHVEKPVVQQPNSSLTSSSIEYRNQFINDSPDVSLTNVLKEPTEAEVQSLVDVLFFQ
uniref:Uncharacterized protein n=1 Tax=Tanacetum cinerariifolium TaxID=118510 RepID=A0A6L2LJ27_TANCI|nr:hypothetical protein [Tanacetum cinerariifolium]